MTPAPPAAPLVSVAMITYNHAAFVGQALDSVLAQRRNFPIEIVVSDDRSPDGTGTVVDGFQARHPGLVRRLDPPHNVGMHANLDRVWRACRGKYIALLEGDDWWHSPDKLAAQVAFMEAHPGCTVSGHAVTVVPADGGPPAEYPERPTEVPPLTDHRLLLQWNYLQTCSVVCRRGVVAGIPDWFRPLRLADWPLFLLHAVRGPVGFLPANLASYRVHAGGVWSSRPVAERRAETDRMWLALAPHLPAAARRPVEGHLMDLHHARYLRRLADGRPWAARAAFWAYLRSRWWSGQLSARSMPWLAVRLAVPGIGSPTGRPAPGGGL